ncbi:hypothetical protein FRC02_006787 [Tulasnella sp. 418]|nr:hypothetical protein FRC02_006787 [Tulasnella sp. 418]
MQYSSMTTMGRSRARSSPIIAPARSTEWDSNSYQIIRNPSALSSMAVCPQGTRIITGGGSICVWDQTSPDAPLQQAHLDSRNQVVSLDISPDGGRVATVDFSKNIKIWDVATGGLLRTIGHTRLHILAVVFAGHGNSVVSVGKEGVFLWSADTGDPLLTLDGSPVGRAAYLTVTSNGSNLVAAAGNSPVKVWDISNGNCISYLRGRNSKITALAFSSDGGTIITRSLRIIEVWDWRTSTRRGGFDMPARDPIDAVMQNVAISPDGKLLAYGVENQIRIRELNSGAEVVALNGHVGRVSSLAFLPDGSGLVSASLDSTLRIWNRRVTSPQSADRSAPTPQPLPSSHSTQTHTLSLQGSSREYQSCRPPSSSAPPLPPRNVTNHASLPQSVQSPPTITSTNVNAEPNPPLVASNSRESVPAPSSGTPFDTTTPTSFGEWCDYFPSARSLQGKYRKKTSEPSARGGFSCVWICDADIPGSSIKVVGIIFNFNAGLRVSTQIVFLVLGCCKGADSN